MSAKHKIWIGAVASILFVAALVVFFVFDPQDVAIFPKCTFKTVIGYDCPGCGSQRAIHDILHLHFADAFAHNALMLLLIPYIILGFSLEFLSLKKRFPRIEKIFFGKWGALAVVSIILIYWVLRNIF